MRFFFYGTLLDPDVRRLVLPHCHADLALRPARLLGWQRVQARHGSFPVVRRSPGGRVEGLFVEGIDRVGLFRMAHFEGDGYTVGRVALQLDAGSGEAHVFLPERRALALPRSWSLAAWQRRDKQRFLPRIHRWMNEFGAAGPWSADLSWHARRRIAAIGEEAGRGAQQPLPLRLAA